MSSVNGKVAIVTGAGSGLGRASALALAKNGARVLAVDISGGEKDTAAEGGGAVIAHSADVCDEPAVTEAVQRAISEFGALDIMCNIAGIDGPALPITDYELADFQRVLDVNVRGLFLCLKHGIRAMLPRGSGVVVNMASAAGIIGVPAAGAYSASKGAVIQLTRTAAREFGSQGIRVNAVAPGLMDAGMGARALQSLGDLASGVLAVTALGRAGDAEDVANVVSFLCSDEADYITGAVISVDGGWVV